MSSFRTWTLRRVAPVITGIAALVSRGGAQCPLGWGSGFGPDGPGFDESVDSLVIGDIGAGEELFAAGYFRSVDDTAAHFVARWDGVRWRPMSEAHGFVGLDAPAWRLHLHDDGSGPRLYVGGYFEHAGGVATQGLARWEDDHWVAVPFFPGPLGRADVYAMTSGAMPGDPGLYVSAYLTDQATYAGNFVRRLDGAEWSAVGPAFDRAPNSLCWFDEGGGLALYAGGGFKRIGTENISGIAKWDGSAWVPVGVPSASVTVGAMAPVLIGGSRRLVVGGQFAAIGGVAANNVAAWDGVAWSPLGAGVQGTTNYRPPIWSMCVVPGAVGDVLIVGGALQSAGGAPAAAIASWDGNSWSSLGAGMSNDSARPFVLALACANGTTFAGGYFSRAAGVRASNIAAWDGSAWSSPSVEPGGDGLDGWVATAEALEVDGESALYVAGAFSHAGAVATPLVAKRRQGAWAAVGDGLFGPMNYPSPFDLSAFALTTVESQGARRLCVGGDFTTGAGGVALNGVAILDGGQWKPMGSGVDSAVFAMATIDSGPARGVYAGGAFTKADGLSIGALSIARWDGAQWRSVGTGLSGQIYALATGLGPSGPVLYAGGGLGNSNQPFTIRTVAVWDGAAWAAAGADIAGTANCLAVVDLGSGPTLFAGGRLALGSAPVECSVARLDGQSWTPVGFASKDGFPGIPFDVMSLGMVELSGERQLVAGGFFDRMDGVPARNVARLTRAGWRPLGHGTQGPSDGVFGIAQFDDGDPTVREPGLFIAGLFTVAGDTASRFIGRWTAPTSCCAGDLNGDSRVDMADLNELLGDYGGVGPLDGDADGDGDVDFIDLNVVLSNFGSAC